MNNKPYPRVGSWEFEQWVKDTCKEIDDLCREQVNRWDLLQQLINSEFGVYADNKEEE